MLEKVGWTGVRVGHSQVLAAEAGSLQLTAQLCASIPLPVAATAQVGYMLFLVIRCINGGLKSPAEVADEPGAF